MKYLCLILALGLFSACNQKPAEASKTEQKPAATNKIELSTLASNKDYVCGMTLEAGGVNDTASYNGKTYGFCSTECKTEFLKDPESALNKK